MDFYNRSVDTLPEFRRFLYRQSVIKLINWEAWVTEISMIKWDTQDIEVLPYVKEMVENYKKIQAKLQSVESSGCINDEIKKIFWEELVHYTMAQLVEAYSRVRKVLISRKQRSF